MAARIRKDDEVLVIAGSDKGRRGKVLRVIPKLNRAVVQGVAIATKHQKPSGVNQQGGKISQERAVDLSNLALIDPKTGQRTKVSFRVLEDGTKVRVVRKTGAVIES
jgi:large subunit ribosomal protein L24